MTKTISIIVRCHTLEEQLVDTLGISHEAARQVIYQAVVTLNTRLFPPITHVELIHTEGCNLGCSYCFEKDMLGYRRMQPDVALAAVDLLFDYSQETQEVGILHFGGEPTLNMRGVKAVTEYAEARAAKVGKTLDLNMTSNGVLFTEPMVAYFAEHKIKVLLSIDGLESTHDRFRRDKRGRGTFERVMNGMRLLKNAGQWIGAKLTVMPENAATLYDDVRGLYDLGVNQFIIGYATGIKWAIQDMQIYADELGRVYEWYQGEARSDLRIADFDAPTEGPFFGCQAGKVSITVSVDGEISPCSKILALNNRQLLAKLGDVRFGLTHVRNRHELVSCNRLKKACASQGLADDFHGGCFASNYDANHDLFRPNMQDHKFSLLERTACAGCISHR